MVTSVFDIVSLRFSLFVPKLWLGQDSKQTLQFPSTESKVGESVFLVSKRWRLAVVKPKIHTVNFTAFAVNILAENSILHGIMELCVMFTHYKASSPK